jgi:hypothetical protein
MASQFQAGRGTPEEAVIPEPETPRGTVIGWHPTDRATLDDPELSAIREAMGQRLGLS